MKRNGAVIALITLLFLLIVGLNFIFMVDAEATEETEATASRSTYRTTPFGAMAFYELLDASGFEVTRFEQPFTKLRERPDISTLVLVSLPPRRNPSEEEMVALNDWVTAGNHLIIIDRVIEVEFGEAKISTQYQFEQANIRPLQPTRYSAGVREVKLSQFASRVTVNGAAATYHLGDDKGAILADAAVGDGRIVMLTDPYPVANGGISQVDNLLLAVNLFANAPPGKIAFDEYHHGYGAGEEMGAMAYFAGTPVRWMLWQGYLIVALLVYSFGRRFARPLPLRRERRTTNLEFVSSMANIVRLAKASDLAMQNIYADFRNHLCRYCGLPARVDSPRLAAAAARRLNREERDLRDLLAKCEKATRGEPLSDAELLNVVTRIRDLQQQMRV